MAGTAFVSIVDDDASSLRALAALVRSLGFQVATFADAAAFLASSERAHTRLLIADIQMPGMGGLDLVHTLAASGALPPTILVTAYPIDIPVNDLADLGIHAFLTKPIDPVALLERIRAALADPDRDA